MKSVSGKGSSIYKGPEGGESIVCLFRNLKWVEQGEKWQKMWLERLGRG